MLFYCWSIITKNKNVNLFSFFFFLLHNYHNSKKFFPIFLPIYWLRKNSTWKRQKSNNSRNIPSASTDSRSSCIPCQLTRTLTCQCRFTRRCAFLFVGTTPRRKMQSKDMRNSFRENREHYLASDVRSLYRALLSSHRFFVLIESHSTLRRFLFSFFHPFLFFCLVIFPFVVVNKNIRIFPSRKNKIRLILILMKICAYLWNNNSFFFMFCNKVIEIHFTKIWILYI